ncbi:hypothetical protein [Aeromonas caviae]|uniref:hypothetical protein n=1 Tax=Aeromonas caviae TaxID=648 RepID=UPI003988AE39
MEKRYFIKDAGEQNRVYVVQTLHVRNNGKGHTWGIAGVFYDKNRANEKAIKIRDSHIEDWYESRNNGSYEIYEQETDLYTGSIEGKNSSFTIDVSEEYCN